MKLSIITINYNNAHGLKSTIESIISQNYKDFEYIVIDGGSKDGSITIIEEYTDKINYWVSEPDSGIYNAMNKGIKKATGEYLLFLNSGDLIKESIDFENVVKQLTGEDLIYFNLQVADKNNQTSYIKFYPCNLDFKWFVDESLPHPGTFIKRQKLIDNEYYLEYMKIAADWAFFIDAICIYKYSYRYIDDVFSTFFLGGASSDPDNFETTWKERDDHIKNRYPVYHSLYEDYKDYKSKKQELQKLKKKFAFRFLKKLGIFK